MSSALRPFSQSELNLRQRATFASIGVAGTLILAKLAAYFLTDSVTMLSSLLDSTVDLLSSSVTAIGVASALRPPDHDHRFGHGKAESVAALMQTAFTAGSSFLLGYEAISRFFHPQPVSNEPFGIVVMVLSIAITAGLLNYQQSVIRRTGSLAIGADRLNYIGDLFLNLAVLLGLIFYQWIGKSWLDPLFALAIALVMIVNAARLANGALNVLMDKELPDNDHARIRGIVESHGNVTALTRIRSRSDNDRIFMELHVEMDGAMPLQNAHEVGDAVVQLIRKSYPNADVLIHEDPAGLAESRTKDL